MARILELLHDIVGVNDSGYQCHPFKGLTGAKIGYFSYTLLSDNTTFTAIDEATLRRLVETGKFNDCGRIRMVPAEATTTSGAGALRVTKYKGRALPL